MRVRLTALTILFLIINSQIVKASNPTFPFELLSEGVILGVSIPDEGGNKICVFDERTKYGNCWNKAAFDYIADKPRTLMPSTLPPDKYRNTIIIERAIGGFMFIDEATNVKYFCAVAQQTRHGNCWPMDEIKIAQTKYIPYILENIVAKKAVKVEPNKGI